MTRSRPCALAVLVLSAMISASCGGGGSSSGGPQPSIQKAPTASGDAQTGTVAAALPSPLRVLVTLSGNPLAGDTVVWATSGTGASMSPSQSVTDASGIAASSWTLSQTAGAQGASAALSGASGSPVGFSATALAGAATQLLKVSGDNQSGIPGNNLALPVQVKAADAFGNSVTGVKVLFAVASGPATVSPDSQNTTANGASATVKLGATTGAISITATSTGLTGSPVSFSATSAYPSSATVQVGDNFFKSARNLGQNPAVDTIGAGGSVTWTWNGLNSHGVQSTGSPSFTGSVVQTTGSYTFSFANAGTYQYDCTVHGVTMTGTIVVK